MKAAASGARAPRSSADTLAFAALLLLGAWILWLTRARVPIFVASADARLTVDHAVHTIEAPVSGRLEVAAAALDQPVEADSVLFQIDDRAVRLARAEELARAEGLERRIESSRTVLAARENARDEARAIARPYAEAHGWPRARRLATE